MCSTGNTIIEIREVADVSNIAMPFQIFIKECIYTLLIRAIDLADEATADCYHVVVG